MVKVRREKRPRSNTPPSIMLAFLLGSDPESRVGREGRTYDLGYKTHLAVDVASDIPFIDHNR